LNLAVMGNPQAPTEKAKPASNFRRKQSDYAVIAVLAAALVLCGEHFFPTRSSPKECAQFWDLISMPSRIVGIVTSDFINWSIYYLIGVATLFGLTAACWVGLVRANSKTPREFFWPQAKQAGSNFFLLSLVQVVWDWMVVHGYTKNTMDNLDLFSVLRDSLLWILVFELTWYTQHRAMHDNHFLWKHGHAYHHSWKKPEHMIGITNFAFDHVIELWVTMSSSLAPILVFPINFYVAKVMGLAYMVLAVIVHWDGLPMRYHINHHYMVVKNYGSHVPIFDMMFGTYDWGSFTGAEGCYMPRPETRPVLGLEKSE